MEPLEYLEAAACALWTLAYVIVIRRQRRDESFQLPLIVLALNFSWEVLHGAVLLRRFPTLELADRVALSIDATWLGLNTVIVAQTLRYAARQDPALAIRYRWTRFAALLLPCVAFHLAVDAIAAEPTGYYSGWVTDIVMFALVARLIARRGSNRGVSPAFLGVTFVADVLLICVFASWHGWWWFPAAFLSCRIATFVLCMGAYLRNRHASWRPHVDRAVVDATGCRNGAMQS